MADIGVWSKVLSASDVSDWHRGISADEGLVRAEKLNCFNAFRDRGKV